MRLMNKGFGWKCSGLSFLGKKIQDLDVKVVRIDPKGGPGLPLGRKGKLRRSEGCEPGSVARGSGAAPLPAGTPTPHGPHSRPHRWWPTLLGIPREPRLLLGLVSRLLSRGARFRGAVVLAELGGCRLRA